MKHPNLKRWIFVAVLLAVIAGSVIGHVHAVPLEYLSADQGRGASRDDSPLALQQKLGEIAKRKQRLENGALDEGAAKFTSHELLPLYILFFARS